MTGAIFFFEHLLNICFGKIEVSILMVSVDSIEIGNVRTAARGLGQALPGAYAGFGGGHGAAKGAASEFCVINPS